MTRSSFLLVAVSPVGYGVQVPDDAEPGERLQSVIGQVYLPPKEALAAGTGAIMVVVVPPFTKSEQGQPAIVAAVFVGGVAATAKLMGQRIDGASGMEKRDGRDEKTPNQ